MKGWVKLWRKSIESGLIKNHNVWVFWTYCLLKANHEKDYKQVIGFQEIILQPGQFIFGRLKASEETGLSEQNIRTCLTFLKKFKNLTIKPTNKFSVISIINWSTYQTDEKENNQQSNQRVTSSQPASNQQVTTNKNLRTKEQKNKEIYTRIVTYLNKKTNKNFKPSSSATKSLINARIADGFKPEDFKIVIDNKTAQWKDDIENSIYLRPQTLFGSKFESYLNETHANGGTLTKDQVMEKYGL